MNFFFCFYLSYIICLGLLDVNIVFNIKKFGYVDSFCEGDIGIWGSRCGEKLILGIYICCCL